MERRYSSTAVEFPIRNDVRSSKRNVYNNFSSPARGCTCAPMRGNDKNDRNNLHKESRVFDTLLSLSVRIREGEGQGEQSRPDTPDPTPPTRHPRPDTPTPRHAKGDGGDENRMRAECKGVEKP